VSVVRVLSVSGHDDPVRLSRRQGEQVGHLLQSNVGGFRYDKVDDRDGDDHEAGEEEVDSVFHVFEHVRSGSCDGESKEPVRSGNDGLRRGSNKGGHDLGSKDPGSTVPGRSVETSPDVEERDGGDTSRAQLGTRSVVLWLGDGDIGTDVVHADGASSSSDDEQGLSAEPVYQVEQPYDSSGEFDQSAADWEKVTDDQRTLDDVLHINHLQDSGSQETGVGPGHSDGPEDGRRVLYIVFLISSLSSAHVDNPDSRS
jgi:hypothetical protein